MRLDSGAGEPQRRRTRRSQHRYRSVEDDDDHEPAHQCEVLADRLDERKCDQCAEQAAERKAHGNPVREAPRAQKSERRDGDQDAVAAYPIMIGCIPRSPSSTMLGA